MMKPHDSPQDCRRFSLSHPMGEGRGEGSFGLNLSIATPQSSQPMARFREETVKTVEGALRSRATPLKRGVNESCPFAPQQLVSLGIGTCSFIGHWPLVIDHSPPHLP